MTLYVSILEFLKFFISPFGGLLMIITKNKKAYLLLMIFFLSFVILPAIYSQISPVGAQLKEDILIKPKVSTSYSVQWLRNPTFTTSPIELTWYKTLSGDLSDLAAKDGIGQANMTVIGRSGSVQFIAGTGTYTLWKPFINPDIPLGPWGPNHNPNNIVGNGTDSAGYWASHNWDENAGATQLGQTASILWKRNVTMPVNMTDYDITSVSLRAIINATVNLNIDCPGDVAGIIWDYARFFVQISTLNRQVKFELAYNQTRYLGLGTPATPTMNNVVMVNVPGSLLKAYLDQVLSYDHRNFTIILGINIFCEDNYGLDIDTWTNLRIKSFNLTISYAKKINQGTTMAWNQKGNQLPKINGSEQILQVDGARLQFKYRSDRNWTADSPNSELHVLMNNQTYPETVKLSKATRTFQDAKAGGFDVTSYIVKDVNISVGIQVYIADIFLLNRNFTISIDDVYLWVNYTIIDIPPPQPPDVNVISNTSIPFTDHWTHLTVTCQSGSSNVSAFWYQNPFSNTNITLGTNFGGVRTYNLYFVNESAGSYIFRFWATSPEGTAYDSITVVWVTPQSPIINLAINSSNPFTNQWTRFMVSCQSGSANVSRLWYRNPFNNINFTLGSNFEGYQIHYLNFTTASAGAYEFRFWANSTLGADTYKTLIVVWVSPVGPLLTTFANDTNPHTNHYIQITSSCTSGSANVSRWWYRNPFTGVNSTLGSNFAGNRAQNLYFSAATPGARAFQFWANSTLGIPAYYELTAVWVEPTPPVLSVSVNTTSPYTNDWAQFVISCQSGSANVSRWWYYNPLLGTNITLESNFAGSRNRILSFTTAAAGSRIFGFWANASLGAISFKSITIVWINPISPTLNIVSNSTNPYTKFSVQFTVTCSSGSANVSSWWYHNPIDGFNYTLAQNFAGSNTQYLYFTSAISGSRLFEFWASSTVGPITYRTYTVVWIDPTSVVLGVSTNTTNPYTNYWTRITITCQSGTANVSRWWYFNPLTLQNITLATNFGGSQVRNLYFTASISGSQTFKFWANSTLGSTAYQFITIAWIDPLPVVLGITANTTSPQTGEWAQLDVSCQSGSAAVSRWWYYNPLTGTNITLATSFVGRQTRLLNFTTLTASSHKFEFWANSTLGASGYLIFTVVWVNPTLPVLSVEVNTTSPYTNNWIRITVTCQSGSADVSRWWYNNPITGFNYTLGTNFAGSQTKYLNFTTGIAGSYEFQFWANSSIGSPVYKPVTVVWVNPISPTLDIISNTTSPYTNFWIQFTVTCRSGSENVSVFWYYNPLDGMNHTLAINFAGSRIQFLYFTASTAGPRSFGFWANSTTGAPAYRTFTIVWIVPQNPILTVSGNTSLPFIYHSIQLTVLCQAGTGDISMVWYYNPFTTQNITLGTNFAGSQLYYLNFTRSAVGSFEFKFWANSTLGLEAFRSIIIIWVTPQPPALGLYANTTNPYINQYAQITVTCISGSGNVDHLWYYNPIDLTNYTLATNFAGMRVLYLNITTTLANSYDFKFYVNSTLSVGVQQSLTIVWQVPVPPTIDVSANLTNPFTNFYVRVTFTSQAGSGIVASMWYNNPFDGFNHTLASDFTTHTTSLDVVSSIGGSYKFKAWAISSLGIEVYDEVTIVWIVPTPPSLSIIANSTYLKINNWTLLTVTCTNGSGQISFLWYFNPFDGQNHTLAIDFSGTLVFNLPFTSHTGGTYEFKVWAKSDLGIIVFDFTSVTWYAPTTPNILTPVLIATGVIGAIAAASIVYTLHFRVPKGIRDLRKMKSNIKKGKALKPMDVSTSDQMIDDMFKKKMKLKRIPTKKPEAPSVSVIKKIKD